jgi:hypothetical protein
MPGQRLGADRRERSPGPATGDDDQGDRLNMAPTYGAIHPDDRPEAALTGAMQRRHPGSHSHRQVP